MIQPSLLLNLSHVSVGQIEVTQQLTTLFLIMEMSEACYSLCGQPSYRVHNLCTYPPGSALWRKSSSTPRAGFGASFVTIRRAPVKFLPSGCRDFSLMCI